ncbi:MAG: DUF507 family protein [bacterium]|nr:DUF507 family protein [bacterium]
MRLSEERVAVMARLVSERLLDEELVDLEISERDFRFMVESLLLKDLKIEDEIDEEATTFLLKNKPQLEEGSTEWEIELERKKEEFSIARGYVSF